MEKRYFIIIIILIYIYLILFKKNVQFILLYFYSEISALKNLISNKTFLNFTNKLIKKFKITIIKNSKSSPISKNSTIYLVNHRSWADFWIDYNILQGTFISRKEVKYVLPFSTTLGKSNIIFFDRKSKKSKNKLYENIKNTLNKNKNIILYPEGTRNLKNKSKPLKFGIIKLGYEQNVPFQICINSNKEKIINEKKFIIQRNITCEYFISEIIHPKNFNTLEEFIKYIQKKWYESWNIIYKNNV